VSIENWFSTLITDIFQQEDRIYSSTLYNILAMLDPTREKVRKGV